MFVGFDDVVHAQRGGEFGRLFAEERQLRRVGFDEEHGGAAFGELRPVCLYPFDVGFAVGNALFVAHLPPHGDADGGKAAVLV